MTWVELGRQILHHFFFISVVFFSFNGENIEERKNTIFLNTFRLIREGDRDKYCLEPNGLYTTEILPSGSCNL